MSDVFLSTLLYTLEIFIILFYVYRHFWHMYVYVPHVCSALGRQNGPLNPLDLELQMSVNHHMGAGNFNFIL